MASSELLELSEFLKHYGLSEYIDKLKNAGADNLGDLRDLDDEECKEIAKEVQFKTLHKKKFIRACKELRDGQYNPNPVQKTPENDDNKANDNSNKLLNEPNSKWGNLNFQIKLPSPVRRNENLENKIKEWLSENGQYYKNFGDPILILLQSNQWEKQQFKENDKIQFDKRFSCSSDITGNITKGRTFVYYFLKVSVVAFNETIKENKNNTKSICNLTNFFIQSSKLDNNCNGWECYTTMKYDSFDPRQLCNKIYNKLIDKYGKELVEKSHLKSSDVTNNEQQLIDTMNEIKRLHSKGLTGTKQHQHVENAKKLIETGVNPNLIIDEYGYRILHYCRWLNGSDYLLPFIKWLREHGSDNTLGPIKIIPRNSIPLKYHYTPWYFYNEQRIMKENGPLHDTIGGAIGGIICEHGLKKFYTSQTGYKCDKCAGKQSKRSLMYGCRTCNFDVCEKCFDLNSEQYELSKEKRPPVVTIGECNNSHLLIRGGLWGFRNAKCNKCKMDMNKEKILYGCAPCKYCLCIKCTEQINNEYVSKNNKSIPIPNCSGKHGLYEFDGKNNFKCNNCNKSIFSQVMYGCTECKEEICFNCYLGPVQELHNLKYRKDSNIIPPTCKSNHRLIEIITPKHNYRCDMCNKSVAKGSEMYDCRRCNYDLCKDCYTKNCVTIKSDENKQQLGVENEPQKTQAQLTVQNETKTFPKCKGNHILNEFKSKGSNSCDGCSGHPSSNSNMYGCRTCNYDLCQLCYDKGTVAIKSETKEQEFIEEKEQLSVENETQKNEAQLTKTFPQCKGGHILNEFKSKGGNSCDDCSGHPSSNSKMYGCRKCNYDLCQTCYDKGTVVIKSEAKEQEFSEEKEKNVNINLYDEIIQLKKTQKKQQELINKLLERQRLLEDEINKLKFDTKNWKKWKTDTLIEWIVSLDKAKYVKYESQLKSKMSAMSLTPIRLKSMSKNQLSYFGIANDEDKTNIWNAFQKLVS